MWYQTNFHQCSSKFPEIGCQMFSNVDSKTATTMSLSILVGGYDVLNLSLGAMLTRSPFASRRDA